jgi:hypothetical protein
MNQDWVQRELGVPLNFTVGSANIVNTYFGVTGDPFKVTIDTINQVAEGGVKIALVYGDRDYRCNCKSSLFRESFLDMICASALHSRWLSCVQSSSSTILTTIRRARRRSNQFGNVLSIGPNLPLRRL